LQANNRLRPVSHSRQGLSLRGRPRRDNVPDQAGMAVQNSASLTRRANHSDF